MKGTYNKEGVENLVIAIIQRAVEDYTGGLQKKAGLENIDEIREVIEWLRRPSRMTIEQVLKAHEHNVYLIISGGWIYDRYDKHSDVSKLIEAEKAINECEAFFRGSWFGLMSDLDPEYLMSICKRRAKEMHRKPKGEYTYWCEKDGVHKDYETLKEMASFIGIKPSLVANAIIRGHRCKGWTLGRVKVNYDET